MHVDAAIDASHETGQHLARATLGHLLDAGADQGLHAAGPLHRQVELANQRCANVGHRVVHAGIDVLHDRNLRLAPLVGAHRLGQAICRLAHQGRVRGHADRELDDLAHTTLGELRDCRVDGDGMAADHDLAWRIVVGRNDHVIARNLATDRFDQGIVGPDHGGHGANASRRRGLHGLSADAYQVRRVGKLQGAGRNEGGVLAEAVPGQQIGHRRLQFLPDPPDRDAGRQQGRLGVFGAVEHLLGTALGQVPEIDPGAIGGVDESLAHDRKFIAERGQHADALRALARKEERCRAHHVLRDQ